MEVGRKRLGKAKWRRSVADVINRLKAALEVSDVVLGGGNARRMKDLPAGVRLGSNELAFTGAYRLWPRS